MSLNTQIHRPYVLRCCENMKRYHYRKIWGKAFPSPKGYIEGQSLHIWGESLEFSQVPRLLYREIGVYDDSHLALLEVPELISGGKARNFSSLRGHIEGQSLYGGTAQRFSKSQGHYIKRKLYKTTRNSRLLRSEVCPQIDDRDVIV